MRILRRVAGPAPTEDGVLRVNLPAGAKVRSLHMESHGADSPLLLVLYCEGDTERPMSVQQFYVKTDVTGEELPGRLGEFVGVARLHARCWHMWKLYYHESQQPNGSEQDVRVLQDGPG